MSGKPRATICRSHASGPSRGCAVCIQETLCAVCGRRDALPTAMRSLFRCTVIKRSTTAAEAAVAIAMCSWGMFAAPTTCRCIPMANVGGINASMAAKRSARCCAGSGRKWVCGRGYMARRMWCGGRDVVGMVSLRWLQRASLLDLLLLLLLMLLLLLLWYHLLRNVMLKSKPWGCGTWRPMPNTTSPFHHACIHADRVTTRQMAPAHRSSGYTALRCSLLA